MRFASASGPGPRHAKKRSESTILSGQAGARVIKKPKRQANKYAGFQIDARISSIHPAFGARARGSFLAVRYGMFQREGVAVMKVGAGGGMTQRPVAVASIDGIGGLDDCRKTDQKPGGSGRQISG